MRENKNFLHFRVLLYLFPTPISLCLVPSGIVYFRNSEFLVLNTEFLVLNSEFLVLNSEFLVLNSEFLVLN
jgi:hypothetical protein